MAKAKKTAKKARFIHTFFDNGVPKYHCGTHYAINAEIAREIVKGNAEEVDMDAEESELNDNQESDNQE